MKLGYNLLYVTDVSVTMDFYEKAFELKKGFLHPEGDYGEMITGETKLGFVSHDLASSHGFSYRKQTRNDLPSFEIAFVSEDVQQSYQLAIKNGAKSIKPPQTKPWGQVVSYVQDINGFLIEICSPMS
jgi:uncharacterized glyoxalase superfamily protein PhnB